MRTKEQLDARRFVGYKNVLCNIGYKGCPFNKITGDNSAFCMLYNKQLNYVETGNNDICTRCKKCNEDR